jgi:hypothetical protein
VGAAILRRQAMIQRWVLRFPTVVAVVAVVATHYAYRAVASHLPQLGSFGTWAVEFGVVVAVLLACHALHGYLARRVEHAEGPS